MIPPSVGSPPPGPPPRGASGGPPGGPPNLRHKSMNFPRGPPGGRKVEPQPPSGRSPSPGLPIPLGGQHRSRIPPPPTMGPPWGPPGGRSMHPRRPLGPPAILGPSGGAAAMRGELVMEDGQPGVPINLSTALRRSSVVSRDLSSRQGPPGFPGSGKPGRRSSLPVGGSGFPGLIW